MKSKALRNNECPVLSEAGREKEVMEEPEEERP